MSSKKIICLSIFTLLFNAGFVASASSDDRELLSRINRCLASNESTKKSAIEERKYSDLAPIELNDKFGYLDYKGRVAIQPCFDKISEFGTNGLVRVSIRISEKTTKEGFVNASGKLAFPQLFNSAHDFIDQELAGFEGNDGKWGFINAQGEIIIPPKFVNVGYFSNGLAAAQDESQKFGFINAKGEFVIKPQFDGVETFDEYELAPVKIDGLWGAISKEGKMVIDPSYPDWFVFAKNGLASVRNIIDGKQGYINTKGEYVIPPIFDFAFPFPTNGIALVIENDRPYFINSSGKYAFKVQYKDAGSFLFSNEVSPVMDDNSKWGLINNKGETILTPKYDHIFAFSDFSPVPLFQILQDGKYGWIDKKGNLVIPPRYKEVPYPFTNGFFINGLAKVVDDNNKVSYIDTNGKTIAMVDKTCGADVVKTSTGELVWPSKRRLDAICKRK